jgi:hypothetical protein
MPMLRDGHGKHREPSVVNQAVLVVLTCIHEMGIRALYRCAVFLMSKDTSSDDATTPVHEIVFQAILAR